MAKAQKKRNPSTSIWSLFFDRSNHSIGSDRSNVERPPDVAQVHIFQMDFRNASSIVVRSPAVSDIYNEMGLILGHVMEIYFTEMEVGWESNP